jgi:hypothetical protein
MLKAKLVVNNITPISNRIKRDLAKLPQEAYQVFKNNTPIKTGNARSKTRLQNKDTIVANYPYAERLNEGYSKQSPEGMVTPTEKFLRKRIREILRKK